MTGQRPTPDQPSASPQQAAAEQVEGSAAAQAPAPTGEQPPATTPPHRSASVPAQGAALPPQPATWAGAPPPPPSAVAGQAGAGYAPPPPPGYVPPPAAYAPAPSPALAVLRGQTRSVLARFDPTGIRPSLLVGGIILAVFFGAQLLNAVLPAAAAGPGPQPQPGGAVDIGPLRVYVPAGWQVGPMPGGSGTRLARAGVSIDFLSNPFQGDAATLYRVFVEEALEPFGTAFQATEPSLVQVGPGIAGARGAYTGVFGSGGNEGQVEGQLTAFVVDGSGVVIDAWGPIGSLRQMLGDVELIISTLELR